MPRLDELPGEYTSLSNEAISLPRPDINVLLVISALTRDGKSPVHVSRVLAFCVPAGIPDRTAHRGINSLIEGGWIVRIRRRIYLVKTATRGRNEIAETATRGRENCHPWQGKLPPMAGNASRDPYRANSKLSNKRLRCKKCGRFSDALFGRHPHGVCTTCYNGGEIS